MLPQWQRPLFVFVLSVIHLQTHTAPWRRLDCLRRLIARDLIYPAGRGLLRFRIPYFPEFVASSEGNLRTIS